jgi:hypothetical protein
VEGQRVVGHPAQLGGQLVDVPAAVEHHVPGGDGDQPVQRDRVGERAAVGQPLGQAGGEGLLPGDPVQVAAVEAVPLPDERQRARSADGLRAGRQVHPGIAVLDRLVEADRDPAQGVGQLDEPGQVDLREVVDRDAGELLHGGDQRGPPGLPAAAVQLGSGDPLLAQRLLGVGQAALVGGIDLVSAPVAGHLDERVARDGDGHRVRVRAGRYVHQHDRVGVQLALVRPGVQGVQHVLRQRVAGRVGAGVQTDQQRGELLTHRGGRGVRDGVTGDAGDLDPVLHAPHQPDPDQRAGRDQGDQRPQTDPPDRPRSHPASRASPSGQPPVPMPSL